MRCASSRVLGSVEKYKVVELFPYKIDNINNFIQRDHIPYRENDPESRAYAQDTWRKIVEGMWVEDGKTHVWMPPKLFFHGNCGTITIQDEIGEGYSSYPDIRDNEWIMFTYLLCCDGFSGFMDDPDFTCNRTIKQIEDGQEFPAKIYDTLKKNCQRPNGTWKKYIEAWDYLTTFYLLDNPRDFPLGLPLYENESKNGMVLGSRGIGKTFDMGGDCAHEFVTNGARYYESLRKSLRSIQFIGSSDSQFLGTFINTVRLTIESFPGGKFSGDKHFHKPSDGNWDADRGLILQRFRQADNSYKGSNSEISKAILLPNKKEVIVSKRYRRVFIDEVGLQDNIESILSAGEDAMRSDKGRTGSAILSGTGGSVTKILGTKKLFNDPRRYNIYPIPNYWSDGKLIGLFIPASYADFKAKDENGNTDVLLGTQLAVNERNEISQGDRSKITDKRLNRPLEPSEIFLAGSSDHFDKDLIIDRIEMLEAGEWEKNSEVVTLELGKPTKDGLYDVIITPNEQLRKHVVTDLNYSVDGEEKKGAVVIHERPKHEGVGFLELHNLYKVVYDPKTDLETGSSYGSIKVFKGTPKRQIEKGEKINTIVAEAKIKFEDEDNHLVCMMLAIIYKARVQYERNVSGIPAFFQKYGLGWILQPTPLAYIKDLTPGTTQAQKTGIVVTDPLKRDGIRLFKKWHREIVDVDEARTVIRQVDVLSDLSLLYEMNFFDDEGNFDSISSMIILMLWLAFEFMPENSVYSEEPLDDEMDDFFLAGRKILYL